MQPIEKDIIELTSQMLNIGITDSSLLYRNIFQSTIERLPMYSYIVKEPLERLFASLSSRTHNAIHRVVAPLNTVSFRWIRLNKCGEVAGGLFTREAYKLARRSREGMHFQFQRVCLIV